MANNKIYVKRTSTTGNKPTTAQIANGELAVNMTDGILYSTNGSVVFEIGANVTSKMIGNTTANITGNTTMLRIANSTSSANLTPIALTAGISVVNTIQISVGTNNFINATALDIGNTVITTTNTILGGTLAANGGIGSAGQVLTSGGAGNVYWTTPQIGDITAVTAGNGLTGGGTSGDVTLNVGAANGITVSADAVGAVVGPTQTLNSTGIHVNSTLSITTLTTTGNITLGAAFSANGSTGTAGFVLKSGGTANAYWAADTDTNTTYDLLTIANTTINQGIVRLKDVNNSNDDIQFTGANGVVVSSNATHVLITGQINTDTDTNTTYDLLAIANTEANAGRIRLKDINNSNDDVIVTGANGIIVSSNATHIIVTDTLSGDITSVTAGNGLTGGGTAGDVTLNVGAANGITVTADAVGAVVGPTQTLNSTGIHVNSTLSITTLTTSGNITLGAAFSANGSTGTAGFVLKSGGTANAYWAADTDTNTTYDLLAIANTEANAGRIRLKDVNNSNDDVIITGANGIVVSSNGTHIIVTDTLSGDITSVTAGNGLTGGGTGGDVTVSVLANTGIVSNATGTYVNAAYINTISSNSTSYVNAFADLAIVNQNNGNASQWYGRILSKNSTNDRSSFLGTYGSIAGVFAHNNALNAWATLYVNTVDGTSGGVVQTPNTVNIGTSAYFVSNGNFGVGTSSPAYKLQVNGSFAATTKSFVIDHPTKPDMKLRYGSLEGPENGVYVRGKTNTNIIDLPDYWTGLIDRDSITVNLTAIGRKQELYVKEIQNNKIVIAGSRNIDCYYTVFAERKDVLKLVVEF